MTEIDPKFLKLAEELLPCLGDGCIDDRHTFDCPACYRPAVALALQEEVRAEGKRWASELKALEKKMRSYF